MGARLRDVDSAAKAQKFAVPNLDSGAEVLAVRELVELYTCKLEQPKRALPILARLSERQPSAPTGIWARAQLAELKRRMRGAS